MRYVDVFFVVLVQAYMMHLIKGPVDFQEETNNLFNIVGHITKFVFVV